MPIKANEKSYKTMTLTDNEPENLLELHQNGAYRSIKGRLILDMTNLGSAPVFVEDDVLKYIKSLGVRKNGKVFHFNLPLRTHYHIESIVKGKAPKKVDPITTVSANYKAIVNFVIDFAENKLDEFDTSALLQTKNLSQYELVVSTGDKDDIASSNAPTINSATIELSTRYFTGTDDDNNDINDDELVKLLTITETSEEIELQTNRLIFDKSSQDENLQAGSAIMEHALIVTDNGVRSDDRITDIKFKTVKPNENEIFETEWNMLHDSLTGKYGLDTDIVGMAFIDWQEKLGSRTGLVTGARTNDVLQILTNGITATQDKVELYTRSV